MRVSGVLLASSLGLLSQVAAAPAPAPVLEDRASGVTVSLSPSSTVIGSSGLDVESFRGIPFAQPPIKELRLKPPVRKGALGHFNAQGLEPSCPQFLLTSNPKDLPASVLGILANLPLVQEVSGQKEDCLTLNVFRPEGTKAGDKLPVLFWIFGGAFELGSTSVYDPTSLLHSAAKVGKPFVFVAVNYRVGGFGFLAGKEILKDGSGNLGLLDQRMGLEWVADNIEAFGGDPDKVTIWGESAGSISVLDQMLLFDGDNKYNGKALFGGAIMDSGSVVPADPLDCPKGQAVYDTVVKATGCASASDTLACLREADYETFLNAANSVPGVVSYNSVALSYVPRPDGRALTATPDALVTAGKYAAVPMIVGDQEDEGTLFSLMQFNTTTVSGQVDYLLDLFFHDATKEVLTEMMDKYGDGEVDAVKAGSPFRTGLANEIYPGFKRMAAVLGDLVFTLTRRAFLSIATAKNSAPAWSYLSSYDYGTPVLGTFHASDILQVFFGVVPNYASRSMQSYYFNFVYNRDPNDASGGNGGGSSKVDMDWPQWSAADPGLMHIFNDHGEILADDFRNESYSFLVAHIDNFHI